MILKDKLKSFQERFRADRLIVLLDKRSTPMQWFWLNEYGPKRHQIQIKEEWELSEVVEEKHYTKDGQLCISLEI